MNRKSEDGKRPSCRGIARAWFYLTPDERKWLLAIAALVVLGLSARYVYLAGDKIGECPPPITAQANQQL